MVRALSWCVAPGTGCLKLKGESRALDIAVIQYQLTSLKQAPPRGGLRETPSSH